MTTKYDAAPWMRIAEGYLGQKEIAGSRHNPVIVGFFAKAGHPDIRNDEVAWCSAFTNAVCYEYGMKGTRSLMARSWLKWTEGEKVNTPKYGDIVVFSRGSNPAYGHVAFFEKWDDEFIYVIGGNQSNAVTRAKYPRSRLLGFRRPKPVTASAEMPKMTDKPEPQMTSTEVIVATGGVAAAAKPLLTSDFFTGLVTIAVFVGIVGYMIWKRTRS